MADSNPEKPQESKDTHKGQSKLGKLEEEALKRKERLKNLKRKFDHSDNSGEKPAVELPK